MRNCVQTFLAAILLILSGAAESQAADRLQQAGDFKIDPPTLHCLGFRWYIRGDDDGDMEAKVTYRQVGDEGWRNARPMLRVNREVTNWDFHPYACENLLAGSILYLTPDTEYEVHIEMHDPDGGEADTTVVVRTRSEPIAPEPTRTLHIYPKTYTGERNEPAYIQLSEAVADLRPGDLILLHAGEHTIGPEGVTIDSSGTPKAPIVFRGAGDGEAVLDAGGAEMIFDIRNADHLFFEDLSIRNGRYAFRADGASWLTVRRCHISDIYMGFYSYSEHSTHWYLADNVIIGRNVNWYPRTQDNPAHTGVNIYGRGHVVCHNRIGRFWDCLAIANYGKPPHDLDLQCVAIDFYNNDLFDAVDDGIEADYGCHNIRVFGNRIRNAHTGLSAQPSYGGPIYFVRNELYSITSLSLKLHNWCTGLEIYHNTMICARGAFRSYARWQNALLRNNLFLGASGYAIETGSPHPRTSLDHNGYRRADPERLFKWFDGEKEERYNSLGAFTEATGFERHGVMLEFDIFARAVAPVEGITYGPDFTDLTLKPDAGAVDAGAVLPNINDGYTGDAPDLGCFEREGERPHYGPRGR